MKTYKLCLICLLTGVFGTVGCDSDTTSKGQNTTCKDADKPANSTRCECVDGRWTNCQIKDNACKDVAMPENAIHCDCIDGAWQNCSTLPDYTCEEDCESIKSGYTCDPQALLCNCNGSLCNAAEQCIEGECILQKGNLNLEFSDSNNIAFEDGSNHVTLNVGLNQAPAADVQITWSLNNIDVEKVSCKTQDNAEAIVLNADNWESGVALTCTVNDANHIVEGDRQLTMEFHTTSTDPAFENIKDSIAIVVHDMNEARIIADSSGNVTTTEDGGQVAFRVSLSADPQCAVNLDISTVNLDNTPTPYGIADKTSITFDSSNWSEGIVVTVTGQDDGNTINTSIHHYQLRLTPQPVTCTNSGFVGLETLSVDLVNADNDGVYIVPTTESFTVSEDGISDTPVTFTLSEMPLVRTIIKATIEDPTVCTLIDNKGQPMSEAQVVFSPTDEELRDQFVRVQAIDDNVNTGDRPCNVILTGSSSDTTPSTSYDGKTAVIHGMNIDNDVVGIKGFILKKGRFCERGIQCSPGSTAEIYLATKPLEDVTVSFSTELISGSADNKLTIEPESMTFTPDNYKTPQKLYYNFDWDHIVTESDSLYRFIMESSSKDVHYDGRKTFYKITLVNADVAGISVSNPSGTVLRERTPDKYQKIKIKLKTIPHILLGAYEGVVHIDVTSDAPDRVGVSHDPHLAPEKSATFNFTPSDWNIEQTIYVYPFDNQVNDLDATVNIMINAQSTHYKEYKDLSGKTTSFTVKDDDFPVSKLSVTCIGLAKCTQQATDGRCIVQAIDKPKNKEAISVSCSGDCAYFEKSNFQLSSEDDYTYYINNITSTHCGNSIHEPETKTCSVTCTGEATNYYAAGSGDINYLLYH